MTRRRLLVLATCALFVAIGAWSPGPVASADLPARLSDAEFWKLVQDFSEPNGFFRSDNLVSNEDTFQYVIPDLQRVVKAGGVYLGVGPDQNFTYITALRPRMAFITDIRRGNLHAHLMYKALIEMSPDRAEFLSRLFSRKRPAGLGAASTAEQLFGAFAMMDPSRELYDATFKAMIESIRVQHRFAISDEDVDGIAYVFSSFLAGGPFLSYSSMGFGRGGRYPTFQDLQMATDAQGTNHAYLGTEESYRALRAMQQHNLIVPVVGNFAGSKALRAIGAYVRGHRASVTTFYTSNVEQYLFQDQVWPEFADNVAALPLDETSMFIRSCFNSCSQPGSRFRAVTLLDAIPALLKDVQAGRVRTYWDVLSRRR